MGIDAPSEDIPAIVTARLVRDLQLAASPAAPARVAGARSDHLAAARPNALIG